MMAFVENSLGSTRTQSLEFGFFIVSRRIDLISSRLSLPILCGVVGISSSGGESIRNDALVQIQSGITHFVCYDTRRINKPHILNVTSTVDKI
jgi:hypothetical protein